MARFGASGTRPAPVLDGYGAGRVPDAKRRSRAFKQKKVYQNQTIIKEVMSKNVHPAPVPDAVPDAVPDGCRMGAGRVPDAKRRSRAFKQKKVYQNRTIIKEVMSKNVHPAPVPDVVPDGCRMGAGRVPDGCRTQRGDQELSNKKKFIKIGPLLRKL